MIKLSDISVPACVGDSGLRSAAASIISVPESEIYELRILRRSVDARRKADVRFKYTAVLALKNEAAVLRRCRKAEHYVPGETYAFPYHLETSETPVIVGLGPAGMFAALSLAEAGIKCIVLERGKPVEQRAQDVARFWNTGVLDENSNVQFGEGGAGTFSDGKLTTGISDPRIEYVRRRLVEFGAPEDILYLAKPHIGTDRLREVVASVRKRILELGCSVRFGHLLSDIYIENGALAGIEVSAPEGRYRLKTTKLILAPGNSARDTFEMLGSRGVSLSAKSFSVGVRIEHCQADIDAAQYGQAASYGTLPASDYKLAVHLPNGRSVYTFCVCPGGTVVGAASEHGGVVTNGMSEYARDGENCCGALLVSVSPEDFDGDVRYAVEFQRRLERAAFEAGGSNYHAPAQLVGDFLKKRSSDCAASVRPTYMPGVKFCNLWDVLPEFICEALAQALPEMERRIKGFSADEAVMTAVETRSSSPVRIDRSEGVSVNTNGLFPCGEGAGYAGGIMSAAVDGIKAAEALCASIK